MHRFYWCHLCWLPVCRVFSWIAPHVNTEGRGVYVRPPPHERPWPTTGAAPRYWTPQHGPMSASRDRGRVPNTSVRHSLEAPSARASSSGTLANAFVSDAWLCCWETAPKASPPISLAGWSLSGLPSALAFPDLAPTALTPPLPLPSAPSFSPITLLVFLLLSPAPSSVRAVQPVSPAATPVAAG